MKTKTKTAMAAVTIETAFGAFQKLNNSHDGSEMYVVSGRA